MSQKEDILEQIVEEYLPEVSLELDEDLSA